MPLITDFNKSWNSVLSGIQAGMTTSKEQVEAIKPWVLSTNTLMHSDLRAPEQNLLPGVNDRKSTGGCVNKLNQHIKSSTLSKI